MAKYDMMVVKWHDAHADTGWSSPEDLTQEPYLVTSFGVEVPTKKGHITIVQSIGDGVYDHILHIPAPMVQEITVVGVIDIDD